MVTNTEHSKRKPPHVVRCHRGNYECKTVRPTVGVQKSTNQSRDVQIYFTEQKGKNPEYVNQVSPDSHVNRIQNEFTWGWVVGGCQSKKLRERGN